MSSTVAMSYKGYPELVAGHFFQIQLAKNLTQPFKFWPDPTRSTVARSWAVLIKLATIQNCTATGKGVKRPLNRPWNQYLLNHVSSDIGHNKKQNKKTWQHMHAMRTVSYRSRFKKVKAIQSEFLKAMHDPTRPATNSASIPSDVLRSVKITFIVDPVRCSPTRKTVVGKLDSELPPW